MSTFREIVYMVLDRCKLSGDDSYVEPEHVLFLASKLRAYILTSKYQKMKAQMSPANLQTITLSLEPVTDTCGDMFMSRSTEPIPNLLMLNNYEGLTNVTTIGSFGTTGKISMTSPMRFATVGYGRWQKTSQYATIGTDNRLYIKSADSDVQELEAVQVTGVFEDAEKAAETEAQSQYSECSEQNAPCDVMDMRFPLEEGLVTLLIDHCTQAISAMSTIPKDDKNSSADELDSLVNYLNTLLKDRYRRNSQSADNE